MKAVLRALFKEMSAVDDIAVSPSTFGEHDAFWVAAGHFH